MQFICERNFFVFVIMPTSGQNIKSSGSVVSTEGNNSNNNQSSERTSWNITASNLSKNTRNVIREIVERLKLTPNPEKPMIPLSIGKFSLFVALIQNGNWFIGIFISFFFFFI